MSWRKEGPEKAVSQEATIRRRITWCTASTVPCYMKNYSRWSVRPPKERLGVVFYQGVSAKRLVDWLQMSLRRNTLTCVYPLWKTPLSRTSRSTKMCQRWCLLIYQRKMSRESHLKSQMPHGHWELRRLSLEICSFALDVRRRSLELSLPIWMTGW